MGRFMTVDFPVWSLKGLSASYRMFRYRIYKQFADSHNGIVQQRQANNEPAYNRRRKMPVMATTLHLCRIPHLVHSNAA